MKKIIKNKTRKKSYIVYTSNRSALFFSGPNCKKPNQMSWRDESGKEKKRGRRERGVLAGISVLMRRCV